MADLAAGPVTVTVPATSANLGPGFDCLGLALDLRDRLVGEVTAAGVEVEVQGEGAGEVPLDARHLVVRSMLAAFEEMGVRPPGIRLRCDNVIPHSRGLGSSSAAIVGGVVLARALAGPSGVRLSDEAALDLANRLEGHPDNVAPALLGGFVVSGQDLDGAWARRSPVDPGLSVVVFVPPTGVQTEVARSLLPETVSHRDAVANTGRAALLVTALAGAPELLLRATEDFLHQRYREPAMPASLALVGELRGRGVAAVVSGAGPTVLAFGRDPGDGLEGAAPRGWQVRRLAVDPDGARVE
ncbi:MAG TPA: homoserine kinase [Marmoricola sp.]|nr:homoserine kinase [Marmoricola sp.]